jgi:hypothetical protein
MRFIIGVCVNLLSILAVPAPAPDLIRRPDIRVQDSELPEGESQGDVLLDFFAGAPWPCTPSNVEAGS